VRDKLLRIYSWACTLLSCCYFGWAYLRLNFATRAFGDLYSSLNVNLPLATQFLFSNRSWFSPILFLGTGVMLVAKEVLVRNKKICLVVSSIAATGVLSASAWIVDALYAPLSSLEKQIVR